MWETTLARNRTSTDSIRQSEKSQHASSHYATDHSPQTKILEGGTKDVDADFLSTFQWREYSIWANF
jgi:hypothetical protein